ncbi:LuxR C-terminal-related transcriptional regulator [Amycolatopsis sp. BJA-103]|uniref:LuxR C-terminal-related transcriptional regulator n=1 Tax=Amycolatopsis sp. BJA-103 TaxID=1911175 RepID=UPI000CA29F7A|nr:LuxR C-terminal-related transcriptional regulator [Amycolatopsis sp. BJA-103]AUI56754.1 hypothetical protein BKN51_00035 [Amycolatopsis sp. BJA-103]AUI56816.1 hypothetical protein BKN51_00365 [Amycolatopsis sp. BJA-103]PNE13459.1 hypothetical protein B1H26_40235 [Amycolatopsis sp. BJA-103]
MSDTPSASTPRLRDLAHCPQTLPGNPGSRSYQGNTDALELITDVRELDVREIWGRLNRWGKETPERLIAAIVSLAAYADPDQITTEPPEWTLSIGGIRALHPDHETLPENCLPNTKSETSAAIDRLIVAGLTTRAIAERVGVTKRTVEKRRQSIREKIRTNEATLARRTAREAAA